MESERVQMDEAFLLNALMENVADNIYFKDRRCRLLWVSRKMAASLGYTDPRVLVGKTDEDLFGAEYGAKAMADDLHIMETGAPVIGLVESRTLPTGEIDWTSTTKLPLRDSAGAVIGLLVIMREINDLKRVELDLEFLATHDSLTALPNRCLFYDRLDQSIRRARRNKGLFALLYIDLDNLKSVNDRHGHATGDQILQQVAARLSFNLRASDTVARIGGDEFAVILENLKKADEALMIAQNLAETIRVKVETASTELEVSASIGVSVYPTHALDSARLLKAADQAMYTAKRLGTTCALYAPGD